MIQYFVGNISCSSHIIERMPRLKYVGRLNSLDIATYPRTLHSHEGWLELVLVQNGSGNIAIGDRRFNAKIGDIVICNSGTIHGDWRMFGENFTILSIGLSGLKVRGLDTNQLLPRNARPIIPCECDFQLIHDSWVSLFNIYEDGRLYADEVGRCIADALIILIVQAVERASVRTNSLYNESIEAQGFRIKQFIDKHYMERLTLRVISESVHLSPYHLTNVFRRYTGYPPMQYVSKRRLGKAQELLIYSDRTITDIALHVGYNNISSFNYAFSKVTGVPPTKFRKVYSNRQCK